MNGFNNFRPSPDELPASSGRVSYGANPELPTPLHTFSNDNDIVLHFKGIEHAPNLPIKLQRRTVYHDARTTHIWEVVDAKPLPFAEATRGPRSWRYRPLLPLSSSLSASPSSSSTFFPPETTNAAVNRPSPGRDWWRSPAVGRSTIAPVTRFVIATREASRIGTLEKRFAAAGRSPTLSAAAIFASTIEVKNAAAARPSPAAVGIENAAAAGRAADCSARAAPAAAAATIGRGDGDARGELSRQRR